MRIIIVLYFCSFTTIAYSYVHSISLNRPRLFLNPSLKASEEDDEINSGEKDEFEETLEGMIRKNERETRIEEQLIREKEREAKRTVKKKQADKEYEGMI